MSRKSDSRKWFKRPGLRPERREYIELMSRAFVNEDAGGDVPHRDYHLPERDDPDFDRQAARAMLEAARVGETGSAETATGYYWGEQRLAPFVREILAEARAARDDRLEQVAERFLTPPKR